MGNSSSSSGRGQHEDTVDFGYLVPQGVYTGTRDYNPAIVSQLICGRRLAPFYRPLEEYEESWDDDQILAARKELLDADGNPESPATRVEPAYHNGGSKATHSKRSNTHKEPSKPEAAVYRGAVECPICFLYYPPNINHSRCCDQAICTECFVQIKRAEPTTTHLVSEPAACPYCVQDNFGIVYTPPAWRAGIGSDVLSLWPDSPKGPHQFADAIQAHKRRQKSFGADSPEVVTSDHIRPDWEAKLAAVRAAVTRRANRRIIMRQVGDRLIPVGITSGRVHAINPEEAPSEPNEGGGGSRRSRRRQQQQNQEFNQLLGSMGLGGQDLEELMVMEAMRLSLLDHEGRLRREAENRNGKEGATTEPDSSSLTVPAGGPSNPSNRGSIAMDRTPSSSAPISSTVSASPSPSPGPSHETLSQQEHTNEPPTAHQPPLHPHPDPIATLQSMTDASANWRRRTSSPPPFAALSAAMGAAATASAVLGAGGSSGTTASQPSADGLVTHVQGGPVHPASITTEASALTSHDGGHGRTSDNTDQSSSLSNQGSMSSSITPDERSGETVAPNSFSLLSASSSTLTGSHEPVLGREKATLPAAASAPRDEPKV